MLLSRVIHFAVSTIRLGVSFLPAAHPPSGQYTASPSNWPGRSFLLFPFLLLSSSPPPPPPFFFLSSPSSSPPPLPSYFSSATLYHRTHSTFLAAPPKITFRFTHSLIGFISFASSKLFVRTLLSFSLPSPFRLPYRTLFCQQLADASRFILDYNPSSPLLNPYNANAVSAYHPFLLLSYLSSSPVTHLCLPLT